MFQSPKRIPPLSHTLSGVAYVAQNSFAYVGAINGSIGCALLLFVIPCAIDLKLNAHETVMLLLLLLLLLLLMMMMMMVMTMMMMLIMMILMMMMGIITPTMSMHMVHTF
jgi:hypothetical protein